MATLDWAVADSIIALSPSRSACIAGVVDNRCQIRPAVDHERGALEAKPLHHGVPDVFYRFTVSFDAVIAPHGLAMSFFVAKSTSRKSLTTLGSVKAEI